MKAFAALLETLAFTPSRRGKLGALRRYFEAAPDPDRGWALAAFAGEMQLPAVTASVFRDLAMARMDPELFRLSHDFVGDLAETVSLVWPGAGSAAPGLGEAVDMLRAAGRTERRAVVAGLLDRMEASERLAFCKLCAGGLRVGVSARLARTALAEMAGRDVAEIEEIWFGLAPPYESLFEWIGGGPAPEVDRALGFRPMMLAHPVEAALYPAGEARDAAPDDGETLRRLEAGLDPAEFAAEWKWDGIRVQAVAGPRGRRLYSRTGEELSGAFPDLAAAMDWEGAVDGELLVRGADGPAPFAALQRRLGRKTPSKALMAEAPAMIRAYDLLAEGAEDLRAAPCEARRARLAAFVEAHGSARLDLSEEIGFGSWAELAALRAGATGAAREGVMLKRRDAPYRGGRPMGLWFKWKRAPLTADCVVMYAQRGHGRRSSFYSDFTFGCWRDGPEGAELAPVGKAYSGFTDEEMRALDAWVRANATERYGPVRAVRPALVLEVAFDAVQASTRHKSGVAMRFPRIKAIRWDKPAEEADDVAALARMIS